MKIKVNYIEVEPTVDIVRLDNGSLMNCGGRSLPF